MTFYLLSVLININRLKRNKIMRLLDAVVIFFVLEVAIDLKNAVHSIILQSSLENCRIKK